MPSGTATNELKRKASSILRRQIFFSYRIVSLGCDCLCRTIPTQWGIKPRKNQGEVGYPFDLSNNPLLGVMKNLREDFAQYFTEMYFDGNHWCLPQSKSCFCHEDDCGANDADKIRERFSRRIANFRSVFQLDVPVLFINHYYPYDEHLSSQEIAEQYNQMYEILKNRRQEKPFKLLLIDYSGLLPKQTINPEVEIFIPEYLPHTYVWNYPEYRMSANGLRFEQELVDISARLISQMKTAQKTSEAK